MILPSGSVTDRAEVFREHIGEEIFRVPIFDARTSLISANDSGQCASIAGAHFLMTSIADDVLLWILFHKCFLRITLLKSSPVLFVRYAAEYCEPFTYSRPLVVMRRRSPYFFSHRTIPPLRFL